MSENDSISEEFFPAYLTTESVNGERIPISGERIVIVLGEDEGGRVMELSLVLKKSAAYPNKIFMYAIKEPPRDEKRQGFFPIPVIESCPAVNVFQISVRYEEIFRPGESSSTDPTNPSTALDSPQIVSGNS